jgi:hypothetical protein
MLAAAALAITTLAACQTKIGVAAVVNGARLSDSDVSTYVTKKAVPFSGGGGTTITPKSFAVETWIDTVLFEQAIRKHGGAITTAERTEYGGLATSGTSPDQLTKAYTSRGFTVAMRDLRVRTQADFLLLIHRLHPKLDDSQVLQDSQGAEGNEAAVEIGKLANDVFVSGRYGTWDKKTLSLDSSVNAGLPSFVKFGSGATADANK